MEAAVQAADEGDEALYPMSWSGNAISGPTASSNREAARLSALLERADVEL